EDLIQKTAVRALDWAVKVKGEVCCSWLTTIMSNLFIDQLRRLEGRLPHEDIDQIAVSAPAPDPGPLWSRVTDEQFDQVLAQLPEKYRRPIEMCELQGMKQVEVGEILKLSKNGVAKRLMEARRRL